MKSPISSTRKFNSYLGRYIDFITKKQFESNKKHTFNDIESKEILEYRKVEMQKIQAPINKNPQSPKRLSISMKSKFENEENMQHDKKTKYTTDFNKMTESDISKNEIEIDSTNIVQNLVVKFENSQLNHDNDEVIVNEQNVNCGNIKQLVVPDNVKECLNKVFEAKLKCIKVKKGFRFRFNYK